MSLQGRDLLSLMDFSKEEIELIIEKSLRIKEKHKSFQIPKELPNKTLGMIFQKRSTRTRVSAEVAMYLLGGHALFLGKDDIQLGVNESLKDTGLVLSRMVNGILARVFDHSTVTNLAKHSSVPIINALSDKFHPLQILADLMTIQEKFKSFNNLNLSWVGDGNNVLHSLLVACPKVGINITVATPPSYAPDKEVISYAKKIAFNTGTNVKLTNNPKEAVKEANIIVTDTFISMGQEKDKNQKIKEFSGFKVTSELTSLAEPDFIFMHCLPRHSEEVSDEVFYSKNSVVFDEAENRLHTAMGVFSLLL